MNNAKWMAGNYGIMVHYLPESAPRSGKKETDYNKMADRFDVELFVSKMKEMGAKWVIFPFGQNSGFYWSPNKVMEKYAPGHCANRDLVMEIAVALHKEGIRFIAYIPSEMDHQGEELRKAFSWNESADKKEFMRKYNEFLREYGEKFGELLDGWWFDGCYDAKEKPWVPTKDWDNSRFDASFVDAIMAGNENRAFAMCTGANLMGHVMEEEDYLAGESGADRFPSEYQLGPLQWHCLFWADCPWGHTKVGEMEPPKFSDEYLYNYVHRCMDEGGGVTINIGIYEDGTLGEKMVAQVKKLRD